MARRKSGNPSNLTIEVRVCDDQQPACPRLHEIPQRPHRNRARRWRSENRAALPDRGPQAAGLSIGIRYSDCRINENGKVVPIGEQACKNSRRFESQRRRNWSRRWHFRRASETGDKTELHWIAASLEHDRKVECCGLCRQRGWSSRSDDSNLMTNKISGQGWQSIIMAIGPAEYERDVGPSTKPKFLRPSRSADKRVRIQRVTRC